MTRVWVAPERYQQLIGAFAELTSALDALDDTVRATLAPQLAAWNAATRELLDHVARGVTTGAPTAPRSC